MDNSVIKIKLENLKKEITKLGMEALQSQMPIKIDDAAKFLKPFANLENAFQREIIKFSLENQNGLIPKSNILKK